jgi:hypothetical protein
MEYKKFNVVLLTKGWNSASQYNRGVKGVMGLKKSFSVTKL